jgi:hypothetical protein
LHEARVVDRGIDRAETSLVDVVDGHAVLRVVEEIEELSAEVQTHVLSRKSELLDQREVGVEEVRTNDGNTPGVA